MRSPFPQLGDEARALRQLLSLETVAVLFVSCFAFFSGQLLAPMLPLYLRDVGADASTIGWMFAVMTLAIAISEVFWGWVVDRINLMVALTVGTLLLGVVIIGLRLATTIPWLFVAMFFYGFLRSPMWVAGRWYMGVHAPADMRAVAMAVLMIASSLTQSVSGFVSGYVTERWGFEGTVMLASAVSIGAGLILLLGHNRLRFQRRRAAPDPSTPVTAPVALAGRDVWRYTLFLGSYGLIFFVSFGIFDAYVPLFAASAVLADPLKVGALFGLRGLVQTVLLLPMGRLADRIGKPFFVPAGLALVALSTAGIALSTNYTMLAICAIFFSLSMTLYMPTVTAILSERIPVSGLGTAMGVYGLMEDVGWGVGPAIGGVLWEAWGMRSPFLFGGAIAAVAAPTYFLLKTRFDHAVDAGVDGGVSQTLGDLPAGCMPAGTPPWGSNGPFEEGARHGSPGVKKE